MSRLLLIISFLFIGLSCSISKGKEAFGQNLCNEDNAIYKAQKIAKQRLGRTFEKRYNMKVIKTDTAYLVYFNNISRMKGKIVKDGEDIRIDVDKTNCDILKEYVIF